MYPVGGLGSGCVSTGAYLTDEETELPRAAHGLLHNTQHVYGVGDNGARRGNSILRFKTTDRGPLPPYVLILRLIAKQRSKEVHAVRSLPLSSLKH